MEALREQKRATGDLEAVSESIPLPVISEIEKDIDLWDRDPVNNPNPFRFGKPGTRLIYYANLKIRN